MCTLHNSPSADAAAIADVAPAIARGTKVSIWPYINKHWKVCVRQLLVFAILLPTSKDN